MPDLCLLHANCQGEALALLLRSHPPFAARFTIKHCLNYTREALAPSDLDNCKLFLYQKLGAHFGDLASDVLLAKLPSACQSLQIPNLFFKGYWPFWIRAPQRIDFADAVLERLIDAGLPAQEIMRIYLSGSHPAFKTVEQTAKESLAQEHSKEVDCQTGCADLLERLWRREALFYTVNHPGPRLIFQVAERLLDLLALPPLSQSLREHYQHPDRDFFLPIHPLVGEILGLAFTGPKMRYEVFGKLMTHTEFVAGYLACRLNHVTNLAAFLHGLSPGGKS
ncbi:MAG: hypothetical protein K6G15_12110 [Desulfovibrio sp.]|nr:hypothetical protein [Desulfovibrio sp.]